MGINDVWHIRRLITALCYRKVLRDSKFYLHTTPPVLQLRQESIMAVKFPRRIPTPEEIRILMDNAERIRREQAQNPAPPPEDLEALRERNRARMQAHALQGQVQNLEAHVQELRKTLDRGKRSPEELRAALNQLLDTYDMEPAEELIKMVMAQRRAEDGEMVWALDPALRSKILLELVQYRMPKLKSVEHSGTVDHKHEITIIRYGEDGAIRKEMLPKHSAPPVIDVEVKQLPAPEEKNA